MMQHTKYHFIGIGGIGMSALARILLDAEIPVSGSDLSACENTLQLAHKGAIVSQGHSAAHVSAGDTVVYSSHIQKNNPEYLAALALKCPLLHRSDLLNQLMVDRKTLAVTGTHGKTTTSSLLTSVLIHGGLDPTFAVGGMLEGINGRKGSSHYFVAEADESDGTFLKYHPQGAIITNVEADHLDHYKTTDALEYAFQAFFGQVSDENLLFYCGDDPKLSIFSAGKGTSYGFGKENDVVITQYVQQGWHCFFDLQFEGKLYPKIKLALMGEHNVLNAAAVFGLALRLGIPEEKIRTALKIFPGVKRRCEIIAEIGSILCVDDYAHHPTEIIKTLKAIKHAVQERRLIVVFQPHRFSRTRDLLHEFAKAFEMADLVLVTDIYPAFEAMIPGVDAYSVINAIRTSSNVPCAYLPQGERYDQLNGILQPHDVLLTLGAGSINTLHDDLKQRTFSRKMKVGLIFGGLSCEHEISLRSSRFVSGWLDRSLYDVQFFGIDKGGRWVVGDEAKELLETQPVVASSQARNLLDSLVTKELENCDLFLPILHGTNGEDGTIQGFFEMLGKPYAGPDYRSAAICMDKVITKKLARLGGVKTPQDIHFSYFQWLENKNSILKQITEELPFPVYVKPVHLGSSVGITPLKSFSGLEEAIDMAFRFDTHVMVEEGKVGCRELEFAVMGNSGSFDITVPAPGEKLAEGSFVDYEKKYGQNSVKTSLEASLPEHILQKGKCQARQAYEAVGCTGMTRVDFLLDPHGEFWLFEMNSIPGLQKLSLFPKIWDREGIAAEKLMDRLVILALARHRQLKRHFRCLVS